MQNRYHEAFIKNEYTLKYEEYQELERIKLTRGAKRLFMFLYMVYKENNSRECSSFLLAMEQIKEITNSSANIAHKKYHHSYIKTYLQLINDMQLMKVAFIPFKDGQKIIGGEFIINQNTENQGVFANNQKVG